MSENKSKAITNRFPRDDFFFGSVIGTSMVVSSVIVMIGSGSVKG